MKKLINLYIFLISFTVFSQDRAVNNYALIKGVVSGNKLYSGLANVSIPLYQMNLGNGLALSSDLTYESNGFRPHVEPDMVGLNWNVNLLGKITRETNRPLNLKHSLLYYSTMISGNEQDCLKPGQTGFTKKILMENPASTSDNYFAWKTDKYYFDFLGYRGYFVIDHDGKTIVVCENANITVDITNIGCQPLFGEIGTSEITLKDDRGNVFIFGGSSNELEINYNQLKATFDESASYPTSTYSSNYRNIRTNYIVGWSLKKAILNNGRTLNAYYKNSNKSVLNSFIIDGKNAGTPFSIAFPDKQVLLNNGLHIGKTISRVWVSSSRYTSNSTIITSSEVNTTEIFSKLTVLDSITVDGIGHIDFAYNQTRNPLEITKPYLKQVNVFDTNNKKIHSVDLFYDNLGSANKRTFLKSVFNEKKEDYVFDYYKTDAFPPYNSDLKNEMGFWNGKINQNDPANTDPDLYKVGLLKTVFLPTGGRKEFVYEPNEYSMVYKDNNTIENTANTPYLGARIQKEIDYDGTKQYQKEFKYKDAANKSTGIVDKGAFWKPTPVILMSDYGMITYTSADTYSNENLSANMYSYDLVHYEEVDEVDGNGIRKYFFSNRKTNSDSAVAKYFKNPNSNAIINLGAAKLLSKEYERGKIVKMQLLDKNGVLKSTTDYTYKNFLNNIGSLSEPNSSCVNCKITDNNFYVETEGVASVEGRRSYIPAIPYLQTGQTTTENFDGGKTFTSYTKTVYNDKYLYWHPFPVEQIFSAANGGELSKKTYYPGDILRLNPACIVGTCNDTDVVGGRFSLYKNMVNDNIIAPVIQTNRNSKGKSALIESIYSKDQNTSNAWQITKTRTSLINADFSSFANVQTQDQDYFQVYDNKGNLIQSTQKNGMPQTTIWGYHQTAPIAKVVGATYKQVMEAFNLDPDNPNSYLQLEIVKKSNLDNSAAAEDALVAELNIFKNKAELKNFKISTYAYDPLVGNKVMVADSGVKESYQYDNVSRLNKILDKDQNILKEFDYNYTGFSKFLNSYKEQTYIRSNCRRLENPGTYTYSVPAGIYVSVISQADAEQKAIDDVASMGQASANIFGPCTPKPFDCSIFTNGAVLDQSSYFFNQINMSTNDKFTGWIAFNSKNYNWSWIGFRMKVGTVTGICKPIISKFYNSWGVEWKLILDPNGDLYAEYNNPFSNVTPNSLIILPFEFTFDNY